MGITLFRGSTLLLALTLLLGCSGRRHYDFDGDGWTDDVDCEPEDPDIHPEADEVCGNGEDDNCDALVDCEDTNACGDEPDCSGDDDTTGDDDTDEPLDADGDGWNEEEDCDDSDAAINPGAEEVCDSQDNDCDPSTGEQDDDDGDGYSICSGDCDDGDADSWPGAFESCDGDDNDCDGSVDEDCLDCTSWVPGDHATITAAIADAADEDTICVEPGSYPEEIDFLGKAIQVLATGGPDLTEIVGDGDGPVVTFVSGETAWSVLEGFAVTGGDAAEGGGVYIDNADPTLLGLVISGNTATRGGGVYVGDYCAPTFERLVVESNSALTLDCAGGGIYLSFSDATLTDVTVSDNSSDCQWGHGGGIYANHGAPVLSNVSIVDNEAAGYDARGGGIHLNDSDGILTNVEVVGNQASGGLGRGGGLSLLNADAMLTNVTVLDNFSAYRGGGIYLSGEHPVLSQVAVVGNDSAGTGGGFRIQDSELALTGVVVTGNSASSGGAGFSGSGAPVVVAEYCNVWGNVPDDFDDLDDFTTEATNLGEDPMFADLTSFDPRHWDLHLQVDSPMVDAGYPGTLDPDGSDSDIGSFGGTAAGGWDRDRDGWFEWWQPGAYDSTEYPGEGWDCDDLDPAVTPDAGC